MTDSFSLATTLNSYEAETPRDPDVSGAVFQRIHALCGAQTERQRNSNRAERGRPTKWSDAGFNNNPIADDTRRVVF